MVHSKRKTATGDSRATTGPKRGIRVRERKLGKHGAV